MKSCLRKTPPARLQASEWSSLETISHRTGLPVVLSLALFQTLVSGALCPWKVCVLNKPRPFAGQPLKSRAVLAGERR
ncbi:hypothetical protein HHUSO_G24377 [Huso huso]|uniref:Uncharacterized protein n=1 Tax=Huso huso TaxID=61971 RepID=A0ABR0YQX8_HUSHU